LQVAVLLAECTLYKHGHLLEPQYVLTNFSFQLLLPRRRAAKGSTSAVVCVATTFQMPQIEDVVHIQVLVFKFYPSLLVALAFLS